MHVDILITSLIDINSGLNKTLARKLSRPCNKILFQTSDLSVRQVGFICQDHGGINDITEQGRGGDVMAIKRCSHHTSWLF